MHREFALQTETRKRKTSFFLLWSLLDEAHKRLIFDAKGVARPLENVSKTQEFASC